MEIITKSPEETKDLGRQTADIVIKKTDTEKNKAVVLALSGELGSGKTVFVQGFAESFGIDQRIISPTFILMKRYEIPLTSRKKVKFSHLYHLDLYRLEQDIEQEIKNLGVDDIWKDPKNILLIEWAEKIKDFLPKNTIYVDIELIGESDRNVIINKL